MKKRKISSLMLMAFVLLLLGCREELDYLDNGNPGQNSYQLTKDNVKTQILHKPDYENRKFLKADITRISNFLHTQNTNTSLSKSTPSAEGYEIYTDTFEEVSYLDARYHSFYIIGDPSSGVEEKLILKSINNQVTEKYILKYRRLADFSIDTNSYQTLKITESSSGNGASLQIFVDTFTMGCSTYTTVAYDCGEGDHHNGMQCPTSGEWVPHNTVTVAFDPTCMTGPGSQDTGGSGSSSGSTGGAPLNPIPSGETPPVITLPTTAPLYIIQRPRNVICNPLDLNQEEIDQINNSYNIRLKIYQYLAIQGYSPSVCNDLGIDEEVQNFVKSILQYFKDHPNATWQDYNNYLATPCEKIKAQFAKVPYKEKVDEINKPSFFKLKHETGFMEDKTGNLTDLPVAADTPDGMEITYDQNTVGYTHTHLNDQVTNQYTPDGYQVIKIKIRMFSPHDVNVLMGMADYNKSPENFGDLYGTMLSSDGTYVIKFTGNTSNIKMGFTTITWENKYAKYFEKNDNRNAETNFLLFMKNEMHVNGISLYKIKSNGKVFEIKLNANGTKAESNECGN